MSEWISVDDRLPENSYVYYLVYPYPSYSYSDELTAEWDGEKWIVSCEDSHNQWDEVYTVVTHWMPLPEPPSNV